MSRVKIIQECSLSHISPIPISFKNLNIFVRSFAENRIHHILQKPENEEKTTTHVGFILII